MPDRLGVLIDQLARQGVDGDATMLAEAIWLAALAVGEGRPTPADVPGPETSASATPGGGGPAPGERSPAPPRPAERAVPQLSDENEAEIRPVFATSATDGQRLAAAPAQHPRTTRTADGLPRPLEVARALRPLRRRWRHGRRAELDLDDTVTVYARTGELIPVFRPAPERWFDVTLLVDTGLSMTLWEQATDELHRLLGQVGAFRTVRRWTVALDRSEAEIRDQRGRVTSLRRLRAPDDRHLVVLLSDGTTTANRPETTWSVLRQLASSAPTVLVNPLPMTMWRQVGLDLPGARVGPGRAGGRNDRLVFRVPPLARHARPDTGWLPIPAMTLAPERIARWARTLMSVDPDGCDALLVPTRPAPPDHAPGPTPTAAALVDAFTYVASPDAARLAVLAAAHPRLSLALLQFIRRELLPSAALTAAAEVVAGGLFERPTLADGLVMLRFEPGVQELLASRLSAHDAWDLYDLLTARLDSPTGDPDALTAELRSFRTAEQELEALLGLDDDGEAAPGGETEAPGVADTDRRPTGTRRSLGPAITPQQHILDVWQALVRRSVRNQEWQWGGADGRDSLSDAAQLLCLLYPATALSELKVDGPDETTDAVLDALRGIGDRLEIPRFILRTAHDYLSSYTDESDAPIFSGGVADPSDPEGIAPPVVESYAISLTLTLAIVGFTKIFRRVATRTDLAREIDEVTELASRRLSAAMIGLLRSFTVRVFDPESSPGTALLRPIRTPGEPTVEAVHRLRTQLQEVRAGLRDLSIGSGQGEDLDNPDTLFTCGWSWSVLREAPGIETTEYVGPQPDGLADPEPYLYFTVDAMTGILDLASERTRVLRLLNEEQQRLAQALQLRYDLTRSYWASIATGPEGRWPLETIPWQTTDGEQSLYFTLQVARLVLADLERRRSTDLPIDRLLTVYAAIADQGGVTRPPIPGDPAVHFHEPGQALALRGIDNAYWFTSDLATSLLRQVITASLLARNVGLRRDLLALSDQIWHHLDRRRHTAGAGEGLWDAPGQVFPEAEPADDVSWRRTFRSVETLVQMAYVRAATPTPSGELTDLAADLLAGAEILLEEHTARDADPSHLRQLEARLREARSLLSTRPGAAAALAGQVLADLDRIALGEGPQARP
ncbi:SCO2524 family protein [Cryptosporangium sp. NPDC051539]|uniref:SCO2524 family protein n=1 Tax=Cryptosporangium sp. NPDC051539 TaxID=3363962 RepID=UPI0037A9AD27